MAIISCPYCGHKISNKSTECNKCHKPLGQLTPEKLAALEHQNKLDKMQTLITHSTLSLVLCLAGFGIFYWWQPESGYNKYVSVIAIVAGIFWYIVTRIRVLLLKRKK